MKIWQILPLLLIETALRGATFTNGGFESGLTGWRFWTREPEAGVLTLEDRVLHGGRQSAHLQHRGEKDWSLEPGESLPVRPGDMFEMEIWARLEGEGSLALCTSTWNAAGQAVEWSYAERSPRGTREWQQLRTRVLVPEGIARIQPRLIGSGKVSVWVDDFQWRLAASPALRRAPKLASELTLTNQFLAVTLDTSNATLAVRDFRSRRSWTQRTISAGVALSGAEVKDNTIRLNLFHAPSGLEMTGAIQLAEGLPEFTFELAAAGELSMPIRFPQPFDTAAGDYLIVPMNEGIAYPIDDESIEPFTLIAYGGHGICMAFWGVTDGQAGHMAILETPDDAAIQMTRRDHRLAIGPQWEPQKQAFGYARKLRYVFFDQGGHVAIAKRYRDYAKQIGLLKTLEEKRRLNPNVDLLVGAVNIWCWDRDAVAIVKEMRAAGIERILWSNAQSPENLRALNDLGVLTSRYDIYQDVMDPAQFPKLSWTHSDWTTAAWPKDIIYDASGHWLKGWGVEAKDGSMISCGVICDRRAPEYARARVPAELAAHPYRCRFIDTTTAAPWNECYQTNHPMTRSESRQSKMELLRYMSEELKLVTGCETGHDASVPFLHYFEGMLSLGPYRVPDAGRRMSEIWTNVPERVAKFQLGEAYRLPLWELVFHDCTVAQWYWGDYNNKLPALWDKRDLFNVLYGTPPMFMFNQRLWSENKARFVKSYQQTCPYVRQTGYSEMTDHRFLTPDRAVQQTRFANGQVVTVNFGATTFHQPEGDHLAPMSFSVKRAGRQPL